MKNTLNNYKFFIDRSKENFNELVYLEKSYKTWLDVLNFNTTCWNNSYLWQIVKDFRKSEFNVRPYKIVKRKNKISLYGWYYHGWSYLYGNY